MILHRFGWVNASYIYGLQIVNAHMKRALGAITPWEAFEKSMKVLERKAINGAHHSGADEHRPLTPEPAIDHAAQVASAKKALANEMHTGQAAKAPSAAESKNDSCPKGIDCTKDDKCCKPSATAVHIPHSHEDSVAHIAQHGTPDRKEHHSPEVQPAH